VVTARRDHWRTEPGASNDPRRACFVGTSLHAPPKRPAHPALAYFGSKPVDRSDSRPRWHLLGRHNHDLAAML
jgi:hypothetical protein